MENTVIEKTTEAVATNSESVMDSEKAITLKALFNQYFEIKEQIEALNTELDGIKDIFKKNLDDNGKLVLGDYKAILVNCSRSNFDKKKFDKDYPGIYDNYINKTSYTRFNVEKVVDNNGSSRK